MLRWLEKRSYSMLVRQKLTREGFKDFYPVSLTNEISDFALEQTERLARITHESGMGYSNEQFETDYDLLVKPIVKTLVLNAKFDQALSRPDTSSAQVIEIFRKHFGSGKAADLGITTASVDFLEHLFRKHGAKSHIADLKTILFN